MCLNVFKTLCAQERARAKRKAFFELRAATIIRNNPHVKVNKMTTACLSMP